ncbi:MAG: hypothetical protein IIZ61_08270, partial [Lachnospiraceae bacterium]|nr:hypothetical protein [Lachnospiraceae bacterium]
LHELKSLMDKGTITYKDYEQKKQEYEDNAKKELEGREQDRKIEMDQQVDVIITKEKDKLRKKGLEIMAKRGFSREKTEFTEEDVETSFRHMDTMRKEKNTWKSRRKDKRGAFRRAQEEDDAALEMFQAGNEIEELVALQRKLAVKKMQKSEQTDEGKLKKREELADANTEKETHPKKINTDLDQGLEPKVIAPKQLPPEIVKDSLDRQKELGVAKGKVVDTDLDDANKPNPVKNVQEEQLKVPEKKTAPKKQEWKKGDLKKNEEEEEKKIVIGAHRKKEEEEDKPPVKQDEEQPKLEDKIETEHLDDEIIDPTTTDVPKKETTGELKDTDGEVPLQTDGTVPPKQPKVEKPDVVGGKKLKIIEDYTGDMAGKPLPPLPPPPKQPAPEKEGEKGEKKQGPTHWEKQEQEGKDGKKIEVWVKQELEDEKKGKKDDEGKGKKEGDKEGQGKGKKEGEVEGEKEGQGKGKKEGEKEGKKEEAPEQPEKKEPEADVDARKKIEELKKQTHEADSVIKKNRKEIEEMIKDKEMEDVDWEKLRPLVENLLIKADFMFEKSTDPSFSETSAKLEEVEKAVALCVKLDLWNRGKIDKLDDLDEAAAITLSSGYFFGISDPFASATTKKESVAGSKEEKEYFINAYLQDYLGSNMDYLELVDGKTFDQVDKKEYEKKATAVLVTGRKYLKVLGVTKDEHTVKDIKEVEDGMAETIEYDLKNRVDIELPKDGINKETLKGMIETYEIGKTVPAGAKSLTILKKSDTFGTLFNES